MKSRTIKKIFGAIAGPEGSHGPLTETELLTIYYDWDWNDKKNELAREVGRHLEERGYERCGYDCFNAPGALETIQDEVVEICSMTHCDWIMGRLKGSATRDEAIATLERLWNEYKQAVMARLARVPAGKPLVVPTYGLKKGWEKDFHRIFLKLMDPVTNLYQSFNFPETEELDPDILGWDTTIDLMDIPCDICLGHKDEYLRHALGDYPDYTDEQIMDVVLTQLRADMEGLYRMWRKKESKLGVY